MGSVYVGTTGYSYKDWLGPFYPTTLRPGDFLSYFADFFPACEINYSYHRMPDARALGHLVDKSEGRVRFFVKAHQEMTHTREAGPAMFGEFRQALRPLEEAGVLAGVVAQYPYSFAPDARGKEHLRRMRDAFAGTPLVAELRNAKWLADEGCRFLRRNDVALCCVDEPKLDGLLPPLDIVTSDLGFVRFHGRNAERWWRHTEASERYHYAYSDDELREWAARIGRMAKQAERVYAFLGNHVAGNAVHDARRLAEILAESGVACAGASPAPPKKLARRATAPAAAAVRPKRAHGRSRNPAPSNGRRSTARR